MALHTDRGAPQPAATAGGRARGRARALAATAAVPHSPPMVRSADWSDVPLGWQVFRASDNAPYFHNITTVSYTHLTLPTIYSV